MADLVIRKGLSSDAPQCARILSSWIDVTPWIPRSMSLQEIEEAIATGFPVREAWVIGDPVAGYISVDPAENHIHGFYVATPGSGHGKALLDHVKSGRDFAALNTHARNTDAHRFYEREGFVRVGDLFRGNDGIDEFRMEWHA